jgi:hypothetical protein
MLSSARGLGCSSRRVFRVDQEFSRAIPAARNVRGHGLARAWFVDGAQWLGQAIVTRAEGRGLGACITRADERVQRLRVEKGQIAGQHQPGRAGMLTPVPR